MTETSPDAMTAEFDTVAAWTADAVELLGEDYALPAGCRGSGSPAALAWLCEAMQLKRGTSLLDVGAGVGGPAAFAQERYGAQPLLTDPMPAAVAASRRLFGLPAVVAHGQQLPVRDEAFDAGWALGVLCTTADKLGLLRELRRSVHTQGRLGLLVLVRTVDVLDEQPAGNDFPTHEQTLDLLTEAGFQLLEEIDAADVADPPVAWQARTDRVVAHIEQQHQADPAWQAAQAQSALIGRLLREHQLRTVLMHATCV